MSDFSPGGGWWQASDGKWYPPDSHPNYRPRLEGGSGRRSERTDTNDSTTPVHGDPSANSGQDSIESGLPPPRPGSMSVEQQKDRAEMESRVSRDDGAASTPPVEPPPMSEDLLLLAAPRPRFRLWYLIPIGFFAYVIIANVVEWFDAQSLDVGECVELVSGDAIERGCSDDSADYRVVRKVSNSSQCPSNTVWTVWSIGEDTACLVRN